MPAWVRSPHGGAIRSKGSLSETIRAPGRAAAHRSSRIAIRERVSPRGALADFVDDLQAAGRLTFSRDEAMQTLEVSAGAVKQAVLRLSKRGRLVSPRRGFYVIVPLEYRARGAPPLQAWLPALLRFHGVHGGEAVIEGTNAVVLVDRPLRPLRCGEWLLTFRVRRRADGTGPPVDGR